MYPGDSGGGFHVKIGQSYYVVGIISSAVSRECRENEFVLFTNIPKFINWIKIFINSNDESIDEWILEPLKCEFYANRNDE